MTDLWYSYSDLVAVFGFGLSTVRRWHKAGRFGPPELSIEVSGDIRISQAGVDFFIRSHRLAPGQPPERSMVVEQIRARAQAVNRPQPKPLPRRKIATEGRMQGAVAAGKSHTLALPGSNPGPAPISYAPQTKTERTE